MESRVVDCARCRHHFITWHAHSPHGCRAFRFESLVLPALEVLRASGEPCQLCEPRPTRAEREAGGTWRASRAPE